MGLKEFKAKAKKKQQKWIQSTGTNLNDLEDGKEEHWKYDLDKWLKTKKINVSNDWFLMECGEDYSTQNMMVKQNFENPKNHFNKLNIMIWIT